MSRSDSTPLISCLCVTRNKPELLTRSICCFKSQSYRHKEMVIVYESDDPATRKLLGCINSPDIKAIELSSDRKMNLGDIRNAAIERCNGEYICQWDDDDWYHERRLEIQMDCLQRSFKPACVLTSWIIFNAITGNAYISPIRVWEGSILFKKDLISSDIRYASISKGEDTFLVEKMLAGNYIYPMIMPELYIYVYHGKNTFGHEHFKHIIANSQKLSTVSSQVISHILNGRLDNSAGSEILSGKDLLGEVDYFFSMKRLLMPGA